MLQSKFLVIFHIETNEIEGNNDTCPAATFARSLYPRESGLEPLRRCSLCYEKGGEISLALEAWKC